MAPISVAVDVWLVQLSCVPTLLFELAVIAFSSTAVLSTAFLLLARPLGHEVSWLCVPAVPGALGLLGCIVFVVA